jgi:hypothetical protein
MHIRFSNDLQASRALKKNGTLMANKFLIGVVPYQRDVSHFIHLLVCHT